MRLDGRPATIMREVRRTKAEIAKKYPLFVVVRFDDGETFAVVARIRVQA